MSQIHSLTGRLSISSITPLFVARFKRSLRLCHLEFDKEASSNGCRRTGIGGGFWILSDFRELSFCGPCGTCFSMHLIYQKYNLEECYIFYSYIIYIILCLRSDSAEHKLCTSYHPNILNCVWSPGFFTWNFTPIFRSIS